jgi:hypothetical protein
MLKVAAMAYLKCWYFPSICLKRLRNIMKNVSRKSLFSDRDSNPGPPVYEVEILATEGVVCCDVDPLMFYKGVQPVQPPGIAW